MKKAAAVVLFLGGLASVEGGCSSSEPAVSRIQRLDLGKVLPGKATKNTVRFTNQEGFALRLIRAEVTCGCLTPEIEPSSIGPGGEAIITVTLEHPNNQGSFEQRACFVFRGDTNREIVYTLLIGGTTVPWLTATPAIVDFGRHMLGDQCVGRTQLRFAEPIAISELEIESSNPLLSAKLLTASCDAEKTLELTYNTAKATNTPQCAGYVRINRKNTTFSYNLSYKAVFDSLYKMEPDQLSLGIVTVEKPLIVPLHFTSSTLDLSKGSWHVASTPEGLNAMILSARCENKQGVTDQTIRIQLAPIKPGIYRGVIALRHRQPLLCLELPCSLLARDKKR